MKCPYCDEEMEEGFLVMWGSYWQELIWSKEPLKGGIFFNIAPPEAERLTKWRSAPVNLKGARCSRCRHVSFRYGDDVPPLWSNKR
jgi:hypothetical protein